MMLQPRPTVPVASGGDTAPGLQLQIRSPSPLPGPCVACPGWVQGIPSAPHVPQWGQLIQVAQTQVIPAMGNQAAAQRAAAVLKPSLIPPSSGSPLPSFCAWAAAPDCKN